MFLGCRIPSGSKQFLQLNKDRGTGQDPHVTVGVELLAAVDPALRSVYKIILITRMIIMIIIMIMIMMMIIIMIIIMTIIMIILMIPILMITFS